MATVTAISTKGGGGGKKSLEYICRDDKTEGKKYVTALNCSLPTAYQEFKNTREMYGKTDGAKYYHFVQSHPSGYKIEPALAHKIAVEFAERAFKGQKVVVATHIDAEHVHAHFILKEVSIRCAEGARNNGLLNISTDDFFDIDMALPADLEEQRKIAGFLSNIDKVIAQSEAEVRNLERQKKAAMQKIFSQEIRFRHDNGTEYPEWEERELAYCFEERDTKQVPTEEAPLALKN